MPALQTSVLFPSPLPGRQESDPEFGNMDHSVKEVTCCFEKSFNRIQGDPSCMILLEAALWILDDSPPVLLLASILSPTV